MLPIYLNIGDIVLEDSGDIDLWGGETSALAVVSGLGVRGPVDHGSEGVFYGYGGLLVFLERMLGNADLWKGALREDARLSKSRQQSFNAPVRNRHAQAQEMEAYIKRQVFPQAPSPTMTSLRRISAILLRTKHTSAK